MDHNEAIRMQAAEKYALGELDGALQEEFEEHFFDCRECAFDIKAVATFVDNTREILRHETEKVAEQDAVRTGGWFGWLKPIVAVPAFAALLLVIIYQNAFTIPEARQRATQGTAIAFGAPISLQAANMRGGDPTKVQVPQNEGFALQFDFTPARTYDHYMGQLEDESGHSVLQVTLPGSSTNKEAHVAIPAGLVHAGEYNLVFTGGSGVNGQASQDEVLRLTFTIEFAR